MGVCNTIDGGTNSDVPAITSISSISHPYAPPEPVESLSAIINLTLTCEELAAIPVRSKISLFHHELSGTAFGLVGSQSIYDTALNLFEMLPNCPVP